MKFKTRMKLEKRKARLIELILSEETTKFDKKVLIKQRKITEDRLKYYLIGKKEQKEISDIQLRKMKIEVKTYKKNYELIWRKLEEAKLAGPNLT